MQPAGIKTAIGVPVLTVEDIISKTQDLPILSAAALAVMREADSPEGTAQSVARYLAQDQALTARVLRLANSAFYGLSRQILDVSDAVVVLGMRTIKNLSMVAATYPWLSKPLAGYALEPMALWKHSFSVAVGAQHVARCSKAAAPDIAFTAGLLHDLGKLALSVWLEDKLGPMLEVARRADLPFDEVERKVLGFDHAEVGAYMGESWNLPSPLVEVMRHHHRPGELIPSNPLVDCVHVADYLTISMGLGLGGDGLRYDFDSAALERIGLSQEGLDDLAEGFMASVEEHERLFGECTK